jgi:hypothetical protein
LKETGDQMTVSKATFVIALAVFALLFSLAVHSGASEKGKYVLGVLGLKLSSEGEEIWLTEFNEEPRFSSSWEEPAFYLAMSTDEIGQMYLSFTVEDSAGHGDIGIFLLDAQGEVKAFQQYGMTQGGLNLNDFITDIQRHPSGNGVIFVGYIGHYVPTGDEMSSYGLITIWLDQNGDEIWNRVFVGQEFCDGLPTQCDWVHGTPWAVATDIHGGIYVSGDFGPLWQRTPVAVKYNENGGIEWAFDGIGGELVSDGDSALYFAGENEISCVDFDGNIIWNEHHDNFTVDIHLTSDGMAVASGRPQGNLYEWGILVYNSDGENLWTVNQISNAYLFPSLSVDINDNVFVMTNWHWKSSADIKIVKYSNTGEYLWDINDLGSTMRNDPSGNLLITTRGAIKKYSPDGDLLWRIDDYDAEFTQIEIDEEGSIYLAGVSYSDDGNDDDLNDDGDDDTDDDSNDDANDDANADDDDNDDDSSDICGCS